VNPSPRERIVLASSPVWVAPIAGNWANSFERDTVDRIAQAMITEGRGVSLVCSFPGALA